MAADNHFAIRKRPTGLLDLAPAPPQVSEARLKGQVTLRPSPFLTTHEDEIVRLLHDEENRAKGFNPLERIAELRESEGGVIVTTTNEKLA